MSSIAAGTTTTTGYVVTSDITGTLVLKTGSAATTAVTIGSDQSVTFVGNQTLSGGTANGVLYLNGSKVATSGTALTFDGSNLGVGTSSPNYIATFYKASLPVLQLANSTSGSTAGDGLLVYLNGANATISNEESGALNFQTAGTLRAIIDSSGNITSNTSEAYLYFTSSYSVGSNTRASIRSVGAGGGSGYGGDLRISTRAPNNVWNTDAFVVNSSANVGIGTTTPSYRLDVSSASVGVIGRFSSTGNYSGVVADTGTTTGGGYFGAYQNGTRYAIFSTSGAWLGDSSTDAAIAAEASGGGIRFYTNGSATERARIDSSGNFILGAIGSGSASQRLTFTSATSGMGLGWGDSSSNYTNIWSAYSSADLVIGSGVYGSSSSSDYYLSSYGSSVGRAAIRTTLGGLITFSTAGASTVARGSTVTVSERARIDSSGNFGINTSSPTAKLQINSLSGTALPYVNGTSYAYSYANGIIITESNTSAQTGINSLVLANNTYSIGAYSPIISFSSASSNGAYNNVYAGIYGVLGGQGADANWVTGHLVLATGGGAGITERARIDSSGNLLVGTTSFAGANGISMSAGTDPSIIFNGSDSSNTVISFRYNSTQVGSITRSTTATAFNTSSDYRLKNTIAPMTGALARVAQLKPVTYKWNTDGSDGEGFIAHELAKVCPHAVTGEKDAVDEDGNPEYQGVDTSFLVATLTAAIQEQQAIITQLQADVAALKGTA